jgi:phosphopantothenoylcysteine decarboxylase / phosphopantothenate---cysteine ligase
MKKQKSILLGVTGGVAAYKTAELVRLLKKAGHRVQVSMTQNACKFVGPATFQALSGESVYTDLWDTRMPNTMAHIDLSRQSDLMLVAPATANFIAKLAHGLADDLLSTLALARNCPLYIAPAMNQHMWLNPANQRNIKQIELDGIKILGPDSGEQACGEIGMGRMLEPDILAWHIEQALYPPILANRTILITAGPTFEAIDPVRGITNRSSGKMGYAIAQAAALAGARVFLISGPTALSCPIGIERIVVETAQDMLNACLKKIQQADVFIGVAAVADWRVSKISSHKLKKSAHNLRHVDYELNPDILATISKLKHQRADNPLFTIGFAAETEDVLKNAKEKLQSKHCDWIIGNLAQETLGKDEITLSIITSHTHTDLPRQSKQHAARQIIEHLAASLNNPNLSPNIVKRLPLSTKEDKNSPQKLQQ